MTLSQGDDNLAEVANDPKSGSALSKTSKNWLRVGISAGLLFILLYFFVDLGQAWQALLNCRWEFLLLLLLWMNADRFLMSYKWRLLLTCRGYAVGHGEALKAYYLATFVGCFLPSTLGADAFRVSIFSDSQRPSEVVAASIFLERALGFVAAALAAVVGLVLLAGLASGLPPEFFYWSFAILAAGVLLVIASFSAAAGRLHQRLQGRLEQRGRLLSWASRFIKAYHDYRQHRGTLAWFLLLSIIEQSAPIVANWLAAQALNIELSLIEAAAVTPVVFLLARLPISFSSFGVMEGLYVALFGLVGVAPTPAFLLGLIINLASLASALPAIPFYLLGGTRTSSQNPRGSGSS